MLILIWLRPLSHAVVTIFQSFWFWYLANIWRISSIIFSCVKKHKNHAHQWLSCGWTYQIRWVKGECQESCSQTNLQCLRKSHPKLKLIFKEHDNRKVYNTFVTQCICVSQMLQQPQFRYTSSYIYHLGTTWKLVWETDIL